MPKPFKLADAKIPRLKSDILNLVRSRCSARVPFDPERPVGEEDLRQILEAGSWAPTAHNMQNFEVIVVDDKDLLAELGNIRSEISPIFIRENYEQLSFSREELERKKTGVLATIFLPCWRSPEAKQGNIPESERLSLLKYTMQDAPTVLIVVYDTTKRAPASEGDVLGFISLGCVMQNMWLMASSLGIDCQIMSVFSGKRIEIEVKRVLGVPAHMTVAYACRLGYPLAPPSGYPRVRRDVDDFTHHNAFGVRGLG